MRQLLSKKYFQDYEIKESAGENGERKRKLIYIGDTYSANMSEKDWRRKKVVSAVLALCCTALFLLANLQSTQSNIEGILPAFGVIVVIPLFGLVYGCVCGLWKKRVMRRSEHAEHSMMIKFGGFFAAALGLFNFVWHGIFLFRRALPENEGAEAAVTILWLIFTVIAAGLWVLELRTEYIVRNRYGTVLHKEHFKRR